MRVKLTQGNHQMFCELFKNTSNTSKLANGDQSNPIQSSKPKNKSVEKEKCTNGLMLI